MSRRSTEIYSPWRRGFVFLTNVSGLNVIVNHFIDNSELFDDNSDLPLNPQR